MTNNNDMSGINANIPENAVSLYGQTDDALEDFPVLKAFQQYIDAEQAKSRKRLLTLGIFFGVMMFIVIAIFVALLMRTTSQNQALNDRLLDLALRDRDQRGSSAVVVQPSQDASAVMALNAKLDEMQKKMAESQAKSEKLAKEAAERAEKAATEALKPKAPSAEELEILRLKALLAQEKKNAEAEKELKRQAELEAYRRKHYPELYEQPAKKQKPITEDEAIEDLLDQLSKEPVDDDTEETIPKAKPKKNQGQSKPVTKKFIEKNDNEEVDDNNAVSYYDDDDDEEDSTKKQESPSVQKNNYSIPVDIKGSNSNWEIPKN